MDCVKERRSGAGTAAAALAMLTLMSSVAAAAPEGLRADRNAQTLVEPAAEGQRFAQRKKTQQQPQPRAETPAPAGAGGPGRYAVLREENKDTGCLVNLMQSGRAQLGPGCRDQGVVVFDPVGWASGRNTIVLRARKGHRIGFAYQPDGTWLRDPPDKRPLAIRKY